MDEDPSSPSCVCFFGDLGAGKTVFIRGMAEILSPGSRVVSPTFSIVKEYDRGKRLFLHYDMYRITGEDDLESIGFFDIGDAVIAVEWGSNVEEYLPKLHWNVTIRKTGETAREITVEKTEDGEE